MSVIINDGGMHEKDPADILVYRFDWNYWDPLGTGVEIASVVHTITGPDALLTKDQETSEEQWTSVRLSAGTVGATYQVASKIVTNENPPQTIERSFSVYVRQR